MTYTPLKRHKSINNSLKAILSVSAKSKVKRIRFYKGHFVMESCIKVKSKEIL